MSDAEPECKDAPEASDLVVDTLRQLLTILGSLLASSAGQQAVSDAAASRSLAAISKAVRRLWFSTPLSTAWDTKEEAVWACHVLSVSEGARAGVVSFYGAGMIVCSVLFDFARAALEVAGLPLDEAWISGIVAVERILRGRYFDQLQQWPADRRCGGGKTELLCASRLPCQVRRTLDLDGKRLSKVHAAGIGVVFMIPGSMIVGGSLLGVGLLYKKARDMMSSDPELRETDPWKRVQSKCMQQAHSLLRRKNCPIVVRYVDEGQNLPKVRMCLFSSQDLLCMIPTGGINGDGTAVLESGKSCALRPRSDVDSFRLRVFKPSLIDGALDGAVNEGCEVRRGDQVVVVTSAAGEVRFFADRSTSGAASSNSPVQQDGYSSASWTQADLVEIAHKDQGPRNAIMSAMGTSELDRLTGAASSDCPVQENGKPRPSDTDKVLHSAEFSCGTNAHEEELNMAEFWALAAKLEKKPPPAPPVQVVKLGP